jgi:riboflavin synthase alpha subunit
MSRRVSYEDIAFSNMIQLDAMLELLVEKGIITRDEYSLRIEKVHREYLERTKLRDAKDNSEH